MISAPGSDCARRGGSVEKLIGGRVRRWGAAPLLRLLGGLFWLALCSGPSQWPWVGHWFESWPTLGLVAGVAGLVLAVVPGEPGGTGGRVWLWSIALAAAVCALWAGPLGLDIALWPTRAER